MMFLVSCVVVFLLCVCCAGVLRRYAEPMGLVAQPGEHRAHETPTPVVGGISIFIAVGLMVWGVFPEHLLVLFPVFALVVVGAIDDRWTLPSWARFIAQALAIYWMAALTGVELRELGPVFGDGSGSLGSFSLAVTIFAGVGVINAVNMSDGMDGQLGSLMLMVGALLLWLGVSEWMLLSLVLSAVMAFLCWNLRVGDRPARLFMGDAGSMALGLLLTFFFIAGSQGEAPVFAPVSALWFLALPLIDTVSLLMARPIKGRSPFAADRLHYHHRLLDHGLSVNQALAVICVLQSALIGVGLLLSTWSVADHLQLGLFLGVFAAYFSSLLLKS